MLLGPGEAGWKGSVKGSALIFVPENASNNVTEQGLPPGSNQNGVGGVDEGREAKLVASKAVFSLRKLPIFDSRISWRLFTYVVQLNEEWGGEEEYRNFHISKRNRIHTGSLKKMVKKQSLCSSPKKGQIGILSTSTYMLCYIHPFTLTSATNPSCHLS